MFQALAISLGRDYIQSMEKNEPKTQEAYFAKHGYYSHMLPAPTREEALQHAMNQIEKAFGKR
jgi:hypothetical protein